MKTCIIARNREGQTQSTGRGLRTLPFGGPFPPSGMCARAVLLLSAIQPPSLPAEAKFTHVYIQQVTWRNILQPAHAENNSQYRA